MSIKKTSQLLTNEDLEFLSSLQSFCKITNEIVFSHREALELIDYHLRGNMEIAKYVIQQNEEIGDTSTAERFKHVLEEIIEIYRIYYIEA